MIEYPEFVKDLSTFLAWIAGASGGGFLIVAWAFAWAAEKFGVWKDLSSTTKGLIVLGVSIVLGIGAYVLGLHPDIVKAIDPYFRIVVYAVAAWLTTQLAHAKDPLKK